MKKNTPNTVRLETQKRKRRKVKKRARMTWNPRLRLGTRSSFPGSRSRSKNGLKMRVSAKMETRAVTRKERLIS